MSPRSESAPSSLTEYEAQQIQEIAAWKAKPPIAFAEVLKQISLVGANIIEKLIPDALARVAIENCYGMAELLAGTEDVKRKAGVNDLAELRTRPLEDCDRVALGVGAVANFWATVEGAATGAGGVLTTILDIPLLFVLSLRTILKIGHAYGYPLDRKSDQSFVTGVMVTALAGSLVTKQERLGDLREIEELLIEETQEEIVAEEALSLLLQLEVFEGIPAIGTISGAFLNYTYMRRVNTTARRMFQERWLRDNGKVDEIEPMPAHALHLVAGWPGTGRRVVYSTSYALAFIAALPVCTLASLVQSVSGPMRDGLGNALRRDRQVDRRTIRADRHGVVWH